MLDILKKISVSLSGALLVLVACQKVEPDVIIPDEPVDSQVFNLENQLVRSYFDRMERQPYRNGDYSYSYIDEYWNMTTTFRKDRPAPATVTWERDPDSYSQKIYVSEDKDFKNAYSWPVKGTAESYDIYNLIPGRKYYWKVTADLTDDTTVMVDSSHFYTKGRRRFIYADNVCNIRDLGGIPAQNGSKRIRYGLVFRGGEMNGNHRDLDNEYCRANVYGVRDLRQVGIAADLDLRTDSEAIIDYSPLGDDIDYVRFNKANEYYYDKFWNTDIYINAFKWMIEELKDGKPVYFHCIYGADRTGTLAFLIEALLGVNENEMSIDYELTSFSYGLNDAPRRRGPKNSVSVYRYRQMLEGVLTGPNFEGTTIQLKIRNFLLTKIPAYDLDWFVNYMLE